MTWQCLTEILNDPNDNYLQFKLNILKEYAKYVNQVSESDLPDDFFDRIYKINLNFKSN